MNIGVITYKKYDENVLLDSNFNIDELFKIILTDKDFKKFEIFDRNKNLLMSTNFSDVDVSQWLHIVCVKREEEIIGTTYNAYASPSTTHKTKVIWLVDGGIHKNKKDAHNYADKINHRMILKIKEFIKIQ